jgi:hypothetical protein
MVRFSKKDSEARKVLLASLNQMNDETNQNENGKIYFSNKVIFSDLNRLIN